MYDNLKTDKKVEGDYITFVVVDNPGETRFVRTNIDNTLKEKINEIFTN